MSESMLELRGVDKFYNRGRENEVHAVQRLDLEVRQGEIVALLGSSGCGKTSSLRMIAGFEEVSNGTIELNGREIQRLAPGKRSVAMAFEGYSLYPPLTVRENIALSLKSKRLPKDQVEQRVAELAHLVEIEDVLDKFPSSISGGQQQRASLARALIREADLYLLDEPMGQLEPQLRAIIRGRLKHFIKERGLTAILVTHDQTEANALADRIAVMEGGVLQQFDTPAMLKDRPANLFTGAFIGEPPMNVFEAEALNESGQIIFGLGGGVKLSYPENAFSLELRATLLKKREIALGVRPHAVRISQEGARAEVFANQWLGDQSHVAARFAGGSIVSVEHDRARYAKGDVIGVSVEASDLHLFDRTNGAAISHGGEAA